MFPLQGCPQGFGQDQGGAGGLQNQAQGGTRPQAGWDLGALTCSFRPRPAGAPGRPQQILCCGLRRPLPTWGRGSDFRSHSVGGPWSQSLTRGTPARCGHPGRPQPTSSFPEAIGFRVLEGRVPLQVPHEGLAWQGPRKLPELKSVNRLLGLGSGQVLWS